MEEDHCLWGFAVCWGSLEWGEYDSWDASTHTSMYVLKYAPLSGDMSSDLLPVAGSLNNLVCTSFPSPEPTPFPSPEPTPVPTPEPTTMTTTFVEEGMSGTFGPGSYEFSKDGITIKFDQP